MARQETVWVTNSGKPATSKADAELGDAGEELEELIDKYFWGDMNCDDIFSVLTENTQKFATSLMKYSNAVDTRKKEVGL